jgi:F-type H+-transporting ATPase subunit delta
MAELATIARPYAEALYKAVGSDDAVGLAAQLEQLAEVAADAQLRQFADHPGTESAQVVQLIGAVLPQPLPAKLLNLLRTVLDNGRLAALSEVAAQFRALVNAQSGISDATIYSAFPLDDAQRAETVAVLEQRFGRRLNATVQVDESLIGGIRVVVGNEVLDTSVKARLEQMRAVLTA